MNPNPNNSTCKPATSSDEWDMLERQAAGHQAQRRSPAHFGSSKLYRCYSHGSYFHSYQNFSSCFTISFQPRNWVQKAFAQTVSCWVCSLQGIRVKAWLNLASIHIGLRIRVFFCVIREHWTIEILKFIVVKHYCVRLQLVIRP